MVAPNTSTPVVQILQPQLGLGLGLEIEIEIELRQGPIQNGRAASAVAERKEEERIAGRQAAVGFGYDTSQMTGVHTAGAGNVKGIGSMI